MGNQLAAALAKQQWDFNNLPESVGTSVSLQERLGGGRFLKSFKCINADGVLVIKVYTKRDHTLVLSGYEEALAEVGKRITLAGAPNVMPYRWFRETPHAAYLVRQYFHSSLIERMSTPPFLDPVESRWLAFQLVQALKQCHAVGVCHGDIKAENVMVTSWGWLYLCDLANFKPSVLPSDDPSHFNYFFCSSRHACALAPERFVEGSAHQSNFSATAPVARHMPEGPQVSGGADRMTHQDGTPDQSAPPRESVLSGLQPAADVFSCGIVLLELFLEDGPPLELPQLLRYTRGEALLDTKLSRIKSTPLRTLLNRMTDRTPSERPSAAHCLQMARGVALNECFYTFAFGFFGRLQLLDQHSQATEMCNHFDLLVRELGPEAAGTLIARSRVAADSYSRGKAGCTDRAAHRNRYQRQYQSQDRCERVSGGQLVAAATAMAMDATGHVLRMEDVVRANIGMCATCPLQNDQVVGSDDSGASSRGRLAKDVSHESARHATVTQQDSCLVILISSLCATVRNVASPELKLRCMRLLVQLGLCSDDAVRTHRVLPYLIATLSDPLASIRAEVIILISTLLESVQTLQASDTRIMPDYVLPAMSRLAHDPNENVRCALAQSVPKLAETAKRFLEISQWMCTVSSHPGSLQDVRTDFDARDTVSMVSSAASPRSFDEELGTIRADVGRVVLALLTDGSSSAVVKRALLSDLTRLAVFMSRQHTNDLLLPHAITCLNDREASLRIAFFNSITGVCAFVGNASLQAFVLPCILQGGLYDVDEVVVAATLQTLCRLADVCFSAQSSLIDIAMKIGPLVTHPSSWVRHYAIDFFSRTSRHFSQSEIFGLVRPLLRPFLAYPLLDVHVRHLDAALELPTSRRAFELALAHAADRQHLEAESRSNAEFAACGDVHAFADKEGSAAVGHHLIDEVNQINVGSRNMEAATAVASLTAPGAAITSHDHIVTTGQRGAADDDMMHSRLPSDESSTRSKFDSQESSSVPSTSATSTHGTSMGASWYGDSVISSAAQPEVGGVLRAMQGYVHAASIAKLAKIRMWETDNMAWLHSESGGGGAELLCYRTHSQRARVHRVVPYGATKRQACAGAKAAWNSHTEPIVVNSVASDSASEVGTKVRACGSTSLSSQMLQGDAAAKRMALDMKGGRLIRAFSTKTSFFRKSRLAVTASTASQSHLEVHGLSTQEGWPVGLRVPSSWNATAQPISPLAAIHAHSEGVRQLVSSIDSQLVLSRGVTSIKLWRPVAIMGDGMNAPASQYDLPVDTRTNAVTFCPDSMSLAMATCTASGSANAVHLLSLHRMGASDASFNRFEVSSTDGRLLHLDILGMSDAASETIDRSSHSLIVYTTESGAVCACDPRSASPAWKLMHRRAMGLMNAFTSDASSNWLLCGSSAGECVLWDLRYGQQLSAWQCPSAGRIHCLLPVQLPGSTKPTVMMGMDDDLITGWELGSVPHCSAVLRPSGLVAEERGTPSCGHSLHSTATRSMIRSPAASAAAAAADRCSIQALFAPADGRYILSMRADARMRHWQLARDISHSFAHGSQAECPSGRADTASSSLPAKSAGQQEEALYSMVSDKKSACSGSLTSAVYCQAGLFLTGSMDGLVRIWR